MKKMPGFQPAHFRISGSGTGLLRAAGLGLVFWLATGFPARAGVIPGLMTPATTPASGAGGVGATPAVMTASPGVANAQAVLTRAANALAAVRAMQTAAGTLAAAQNNLGMDPNHPGQPLPDVPDGLASPDPNSTGPGLRIDVDAQGNPVLWQGAGLPTSSGNQVTITQTQQQALLQWRTFDIGRKTALNYDQSAGGDSAGQWVAFNKINDPSGRPSQILGAIKTLGPNGSTGGQVYVINQNGIIFGGSAQVNVHALVASSLPINDNLVSAGLLNNPDSQFLFTALPQSAGNVTPAFTPPPPPAGQIGDVTVQPGAQLTAVDDTANHAGGRIALIGPNVSNAGTISTGDGQAILAAGLQVGFVPHAQADPTLRGLDVYVGEVADNSVKTAAATTGTAANDRVTAGDGSIYQGLIEAPRGNVTITGKTVNQLGAIDSSTSVAYNGRVDLLADYNAVVIAPSSNNGSSSFSAYFNPKTAGTVALGPGSVTQILPDPSTTDRTVGTQLALPSLVDIQGNSIHLQSAADPATGAIIVAPGASLPPSNATSDQPQTNQAVALATSNNLNFSTLSGGVTLNAGNWILDPGNPQIQYRFLNTSDPVNNPHTSSGQIYLDPGAAIDVAGWEEASASVAENIVPVQLRGTELANSPLQRNGPLRGQTVQVDIRQTGTYNGQPWAGTPLGDTSGYVNLVERTADELSTGGGTVSLNAGDSVVMQPGSTVNVSGGWTDYQGGIVQTTQVMSGGHVMDISKATPDLVYSGIFNGTTSVTDPKWGVTETFTSPLSLLSGAHYESGYLQGGNGGSVSITTPAMALDGGFFGNTVAGSYQRTPPAQVTGTFGATAIAPTMQSILGVPQPGALSLTFHGENTSGLATPPATAPNITVESGGNPLPADPFQLDGSGQPLPLRQDRQAAVFLSPDLVDADGLGSLAIYNSEGDITVPSGVSLTAPAGGGVAFTGANITIDGGISAPSGALSFTVDDASPLLGASNEIIAPTSIPVVHEDRGQFTLGPAASLSTAGLIVDDQSTAAAPGSLPLLTDGGSIAIKAYRTDLSKGSTIDVSGGVDRSAAGKLAYGAGGSLTINGGQDPGSAQLGQVPGANDDFLGHLVLDATLTGYSGKAGSGGTLSILAPFIQVGGNQLLTGDARTLWLDATDASGNLAAPDFFSQGGFSTFKLTGLGGAARDASGVFIPYQFVPGFMVAPATTVAPQVSGWMAVTPADGGLALTPTLLPAGQRTPASLSFTAKGVSGAELIGGAAFDVRGDLVVAPGAFIQTDPLGSVTLSGGTVAMLGSIFAPGGQIEVDGGKGKTTDATFQDPADANLVLPTIDLGPASTLSAAGTSVLTPDPSDRGLRTGRVVDGGTITMDGNIVAEAGATLDVSGASDQFDVLSSYTGASTGAALNGSPAATQFVRVKEDSNGGQIEFTGEEELLTDATLKGFAGGPSATGGILAISSGRSLGPLAPPQDPTLILTQSGQTIPAAFYNPASGQTAIGHPVLMADGKTPVTGEGYFAASSFENGGFASLALGKNVQYSGAVTLTASGSLTVGTGGVVLADPSVASSLTLTAPYVALGQAFLLPLQPGDQSAIPFRDNGGNMVAVPPTYGAGSLNVSATLIDIGNLSLQGIGTTNFNAGAGDIRGDGTLDAAGSIAMNAGQIYVPTATTFSVAAYDYQSGGSTHSGSVTVTNTSSVTPPLPFSAGGTLNVFASTIDQAGVLRAPLGRINLGWDGTGAQPWTDPIAGSPPPVTQTLTLSPGSVTSISAVDPTTGQALTIPYGINLNGTQWIDPTGTDITLTGVQFDGAEGGKINLSAVTLDDQPGSSVDIRGGGDLYAYQWVSGTGGTADILNTNTSFAIIPGYQADYAPYAPYNSDFTSQTVTNLLPTAKGSLLDPGYANTGSKFHVGDQVHLQAGNGLSAGNYTLLPARYALLPGAYLVTPNSGTPTGTVAKPDGSVLVSGYRFNAFDSPGSQPLFSSFELASNSVVRQRAQYDDFSADTYIRQKAQAQNLAVPTLPVDSGQLVLSALDQMIIAGKVASKSLSDAGRGGLVDIDSSSDIWIVGPDAHPPAGALVLDSGNLSNFGAESLLIGGVRQATASGTTVAVDAGNVEVDNAGESLHGPEITLVAKNGLTVAPDADIEQQGALSSSAETLLPRAPVQLDPNASVTFSRGGAVINFPQGIASGDTISASVSGTIAANGVTSTFTAGSPLVPAAGSIITLDSPGTLTAGGSGASITIGDGALLRVSSDSSAQIARTGAADADITAPAMAIGQGAKIAGASVTLDSTGTTSLDPRAALNAQVLALDSGQISLQLGSGGHPQGLVLSSDKLQDLQNSANALSLLSYSSIDVYAGDNGAGQVGTSAFASLALHAGEIRGFNTTGTVTFSARQILLDNSANVAGPGPAAPPGGALEFDAGTIELGANRLGLDQYANVTLNASDAILLQGSGGLTAQQNLAMAASVLTGTNAASQTITAQGALTITNPTGAAAPTVTGDLGSSLTLTGSSIVAGGDIVLHSGVLKLHATNGNVLVGSTGVLDVSGTAQTFFDQTQYTNGGQISLASDNGSVILAAGGTVDVSAQPAAGNAGSLSITTAPSSSGTLANSGTLLGQGGTGGSFSLDVGSLPSVASLDAALNAGGFTQSRSFRVRHGDVAVDGTAHAHTYAVSADQGNITVTGTIDASGLLGSPRSAPLTGSIDAADPTGGTIDLAASDNLTLAPTAWLTAAGYCYDDAGKGGSISLAAGSYTNATFDQNAVVDIQPGAQIDLGVANQFTTEDLALNPGVASPVDTRTDLFTGTLLVSEPQTAFGNGAPFASLPNNVRGASSIVLEGAEVFDLSGTGGVVSTTGSITAIGSGGIIDSTVEQAVKNNGTTFLSGITPGLLNSALFQVEPGAEIVNNGTAAGTSIYTLYAAGTSTTGSSIAISVPKNSTVTVPVPGGIFMGDTITLSGSGLTFTVNFVKPDGTLVSSGSLTGFTPSATDPGPVQSIAFKNTSPTVAKTGTLLLSSGSVPVAVVVPAGTALSSNRKTTNITTAAGDLTLANSWDLSTYRFGPNATSTGSGEPGILTLRAAGNLVFNFDASLSDGFDPTNAASTSFPLWSASMLPAGSRSWSYNLVAGADLTAADFQRVAPGAGSLRLGFGSPALPIPSTTVTRSSIVPNYYQVIRTGTGDIGIFAGQDVQLLNPLATIYTAGTQAGALANFDLPNLDNASTANRRFFSTSLVAETPVYPAQYSLAGGNVTISAQNDIVHELIDPATGDITPDSSAELPVNWLYRRGNVGANGQFQPTDTSTAASSSQNGGEVASTSWWIDFSNFFEGVGALGGGNVTLLAGHDVRNVDAVVPTNARMTKQLANGDKLAAHQALSELGGGDLAVQAGDDIDGGVYYVERGSGTLSAGHSVLTNSTRAAVVFGTTNPDPSTWLPTTLFLGQGSFAVTAGADLLLGPVANPFLQPQGVNNTFFDKTYFSTYATTDAVTVSSLTGNVTLKNVSATAASAYGGDLINWYDYKLAENSSSNSSNSLAARQPWLELVESNVLPASDYFKTAAALMPATLRATAFSGDLNLVGGLTLSPSPSGTVALLAQGSINGVQPNGFINQSNIQASIWTSGIINLSDADPNRLPGIASPLSLPALPSSLSVLQQASGTNPSGWNKTPDNLLSGFVTFFSESGSFTGTHATLQSQQALHADLPINPGDPGSPLGPLHYNDPNPVQLYAATGDISGLTLFAGKKAQAVAGEDITDVALYLQNNQPGDTSVVAAGRDILAYDPNSSLRLEAQTPGNELLPGETQPGPGSGEPTAGDIQIGGPGTLEVLAGRNFDLGTGTSNADGTSVGLTSIGKARNPSLPFGGASVIGGAGLGSAAAGLSHSPLAITNFVAGFLNPASSGTEAARYLPDLGALMGMAGAGDQQVWNAFSQLLANEEEKADSLALDIFYLVLRDAGRDFRDPSSPGFNNYNAGFAAIAALFPGNAWQGDLSLSSRDLKTENGGDISLFAPGGGLTLGFEVAGAGQVPPGIVTEHGGNISIFTRDSVDIGVQRIFTLRGGNEIIWSSTGDIAAGRSSKTVQTAPPTEVLIDPQSADVKTDLAGLATGGGIGVLAAVAGVPLGNVDLIAPAGFVDAGDAGIRATGNLNIAAVQVLNSSNIAAGGQSSGTPAPVSTSSIALPPPANAATAANNAADQAAREQARAQAQQQQEMLPSIITVEVLGYGGGEGPDDTGDQNIDTSGTGAGGDNQNAGGDDNDHRERKKKR